MSSLQCRRETKMSQEVSTIWDSVDCPPYLSLIWDEEEDYAHEQEDWGEFEDDRLTLAEQDETGWKSLEALLETQEEEKRDRIAQSAQDILRDLETLREAQDAPDFTRRPTDEAYKAAYNSLSTAYTHYIGSALVPAIAPDGDGGVVIQWKTGKREVRLVVPPEGEEKSYIFSRGDKTAKVDYDISGSILAQQLRSTFA